MTSHIDAEIFFIYLGSSPKWFCWFIYDTQHVQILKSVINIDIPKRVFIWSSVSSLKYI